MRIFVSSVMAGFEEYREAAFAAIQSLDHDIVLVSGSSSPAWHRQC